MKILFLSDNFIPEVNAPATRSYEHCKVWAKQGVDITIITCQPNFPNGIIFDGYKNKLYSKEEIDGIKIVRVWSYITANKGFLKRTFDYLSFGIMALFAGLFIKTDLIIGTSPQFFTAVSARWLAFFKRKPWIMEVRDLWPESIAAVGVLKESDFLYKLLSRIEIGLYKSANKIITLTFSFRDHISKRGIGIDKIDVITNGVNLENFKPIEKDQDLLNQLGLNNKFVIGYMGTLGMAHKLDFILTSAAKLNDDKVHFIIQGDGAEKEILLKLHDQLNLKNVTFLPSVGKHEISRYISIIDIALVNLKKSDTFKTVIPSKIFENAAMGKPILLGVDGESKDIINKFMAGACFEPENEMELLTAIAKLRKQENYEVYKNGALALAKEFDRKTLAMNMLKIISE